MTITLIVLAHPERNSFNGAWARSSRRAAEALGQKVLVSDLYSFDFDPVEGKRHYQALSSQTPFDPLKVQEEAVETENVPKEILSEVEKLQAANQIIFHFPIWWFAPPAVLKGWFDRVLLHGLVHSVGERFDKGKFNGKTALFCVTTGANELECGYDGKEGDVRMWLWPSAQTLRYLGFSIKEPEVVHGIHGYHTGNAKNALETRLSRVLHNQASVVENLRTRADWQFNSDNDFDEDGRLKPDSPSYSHFIRHEP